MASYNSQRAKLVLLTRHIRGGMSRSTAAIHQGGRVHQTEIGIEVLRAAFAASCLSPSTPSLKFATDPLDVLTVADS